MQSPLLTPKLLSDIIEGQSEPSNLQDSFVDLSEKVVNEEKGQAMSLLQSMETLLEINGTDISEDIHSFSIGVTPTHSRAHSSIHGSKILASHTSIHDESVNVEEENITDEIQDAPEIDRASYILQIREAMEARERLKLANIIFQNKLAEYYKKKKDNDEEKKAKQEDEANNGNNTSGEQEQRYMALLNTMSALQTEYDNLQKENTDVLNETKAKATAKMEECQQKLQANAKYRSSVASGAENTRTGKSIPRSSIDQLEALDLKKNNDVIAMRLENLKLRNKLRRQEQILKHKEELAEGLHLIDFEQLKIENQTYVEKIEERNEDLSKLKAKISYIVQTLTHVKEKLECKNEEQQLLQKELKELDTQVKKLRDALPYKKKELMELKARNSSLKDKGGLSGNVALLRDYEDNLEVSKSRYQALEDEFQSITEKIKIVRYKIEKKNILA